MDNSRIRIITSIIMMALMAMIVVSTGMARLLQKNVSALTNVERYIQGWDDSIYSHRNGVGVGVQLATLGNTAFQKHSDAYVNGYIGGIDNSYGLKLPYMDYRPASVANDDDNTTQHTFTFYHQSTDPDQ